MLVKQRLVRILSKCKRSGVQRDRGQDFVLHTLILRVRRKRRTKNCSFDVAMRHFEKKSGISQAADGEFYHGKKRFWRFFSAQSSKLTRLGRSLFSLKAHCARVEKKTLSAVFAKAAL